YQDILNVTDTSGAGATPGFVHDAVGTPNSFADNIFTIGGSKDTSGISQWNWKVQMPQDKDDIADAFAASYADAVTGHQFVFAGLDRYSANGNATVGFWFFQQPVAAVAGGTFGGVHTDGDRPARSTPSPRRGATRTFARCSTRRRRTSTRSA